MSVTPAKRRKARHYGMQALYQWHMTGTEPHAIEAEFRTDYDMTHVDMEYFHELLSKIPNNAECLDQDYRDCLQGRSLEELDAITQSLLRMATYEFKYRMDVPYKVVISEAVSLGKKFGATDSFKFINGVLDQLALKLRAVETQSDQ